MKTKIFDLNNQESGSIELNEVIFGLDVRQDLIKRVVDWQRAKAMAGTHKTKTVSDVSGTTKKPFKQKGTGNARQGSLRSNQMRGGGIVHGPKVRSHATNLPKKVRKLGMCHALSMKANQNKLRIVDSLDISDFKTKTLLSLVNSRNSSSYLIIGADKLNNNIVLASKNLPYVTALPQIGANVYDIIKHDEIIILKDAITILEERLNYAKI